MGEQNPMDKLRARLGQPRVEQKESEPATTIDLLLVEAYKKLGELLTVEGGKSDVVYYPFCGKDASPSEGFMESRRIIYVDSDVECAKIMARGNARTSAEIHVENGDTYDPGEPVDVLLLINPGLGVDIVPPLQHVADNGAVLARRYHGVVRQLIEQKELMLEGVLTKRDKGMVEDRVNQGEYYEEVDSDDSWRAAPRLLTIASYDEAAKLVARVTGKQENILSEYRELLERARAVKRRELAGQATAEEIESIILQSPFLPLEIDTGTGEKEEVELTMRLPYKKGSPSDVFVFRKRVPAESDVNQG